ncbi:MAG TPA: RNA 2',3'-cyclic phosphodiesterase [Gemmatimonadaceae bacterium]
MRLFVAINLPDALRRAAFDAAAPLREVLSRASWVPEARLHLTVKFLGERAESDVALLADTLLSVAAGHRAMTLRLAGAGAFPNLRRPRVVWIGVDPDPRLELLHHDVEEALAGVGVELEGKPFRPHLTLGRVREAPTPDQRRALAQAARRVRFEGEAQVESLDLMQSVMGAPGGPRYERLAAAPLRPPSSHP